MAHRIEIGFREGIRDALGEKIKRRINEHLHLPVEAVRTVEVYTLDGEFSREELERAAAGPLSDAVTQRYAIDAAVAAARPAAEAAWDFDWLIEVGFRPGVTDNVGKTAREAIAVLLGIPTGGAAAPGIAATAASATALSSPPAAPGAADGLLTGDYSDSLSVDKDNDSTAAGAPTATATPRENRPSGAAGEAASAPASDHAAAPAPAPRPFRVHTSRQYLLRGALSRDEAERVASQLLANDLIERYEVVARADWDPVRGLPPFVPRVTGAERPTTELIDLDVADDALSAISNDRVLALTLEEMQLLRDYFRNPAVQAERARVGLPAAARITDAELECLAQTWSEHCKHKIFNSRIAYDDGTGRITEIDSLFKTYIKGATERIRAARTARGAVDFCLSVFVDNAGVIRFNDDYNLVFKVETHNSPSALDPYGGALTGIVGVNRDPFGTGMGAKLIFNTDVFCFAPPDYDRPLPKRILHPRRIYEGVREGVEHGGNKSGIPTVNGCLVFDERYLGKPLVYCGTGGIMPARLHGKPSHIKEIVPGDLIVMTGGRIGKDGIHGATFSSEELHEGSPVTAVQIGDPITQKKMTDFLLVARDRGLYRCITDNGAGGLSSSVGETARLSGGCDLDLKRAPLKYPGLNPWEILISESQERMTLAVPPERIAAFLALAAKMDVEATVLGTYTDTGMFHIRYGGETVAYLDMDFLHDGLPQMRLRARWERPRRPEPDLPAPADLGAALRRMLSRLNICSKESVVRQYDHEVQGGSVVKPLVGVANDGPGDAAVLRPLLDTFEGIVVANGICPRYSDIDAYDMAACAIDEAVRNAVAVGADPDYLAGLDNFCWCDPVASEKTPDGEYKLAQLVRANQAVYDYTTAYGVPCISGKDSMKNDYAIEGTKISIPPTLLFSVLGRIADVRRAVTMDAKRAGDIVYVLGETKNELGGSEWYALHGCVGDNCPRVDAAAARRLYAALHRAMTAGLVASCHDCSDGGLGIALAETAFAGGLGMEVELGKVPRRGLDRDDYVLFSETASRFVVTVAPDKREEFEATMREIRGDTSHISPATGSGEATAGETLTGMAEVPTIKVPTIAEKSPEPPPVVFAAVGVVTDEPLLTIRGLAGEIILHEPLAELKAAWQQPLP
jgi:phosphoribosylformylglycinamidine synthase